mmetsp:Transcript_16565/g.36635  ORF Transcript_16565/g.36635 Transcript_16565/m.36635 type:complete len:215 (+) Transcript_16565:1026-1670(+)
MFGAVAARRSGVEHSLCPSETQHDLLGRCLVILGQLWHGLLHTIDDLLAGNRRSAIASISLLLRAAQDGLYVACLLGHGIRVHLLEESLRKFIGSSTGRHPSFLFQILLLSSSLHRILLPYSLRSGLLRTGRRCAPLGRLRCCLNGVRSVCEIRVSLRRPRIPWGRLLVVLLLFAGVGRVLLHALRLPFFTDSNPATSLHSLDGKSGGRRLHCN